MKAAFNTQPGRFEVREVSTPEPQPGEALVRVRAAGICGTDKNEFRRERPPRVAGHEFSGVAERIVGGDGRIKPGDRVVASPFTPAGVIGYTRPGSFAEYCPVPVSALIPLPAHVSFAEGSLTEPLAVGLHATTRTAVKDKICVVFGAGTIGMFTALVCRTLGAGEIWVVDIEAKQLTVAEKLGLRTRNSREDPELKDLIGVVDIAFECVGHHRSLLDAALRITRPGGAVVLVGAGHESIPFAPVAGKGLILYGSIGTSMEELRQALDLIANGKVPVNAIISATFPLERMNEAFAASLTAQKVIVEP